MIQWFICKAPVKSFTVEVTKAKLCFNPDMSISEPHQPKETVSMACGLRVTPETALPSFSELEVIFFQKTTSLTNYPDCQGEKGMVGIGNDYNHY